MLQVGLSSSMFPNFTVDKVIELAKRNECKAIEWSSEFHVPIGDLGWADEVKRLTLMARINPVIYSTYFRFGADQIQFEMYKKILATAKAIGASFVKIIIGNVNPQYINEISYKKMILETKINIEQAKKMDLGLLIEYHLMSLSESEKLTFQFLEEINNEALSLIWHPHPMLGHNEQVKSLTHFLPFVHFIKTNEISASYIDFLKVLNENHHDAYILIDHVGTPLEENTNDQAKLINQWIKIL